MRVLINPWKTEFLELVSSSKKSIKITSPFVKNNICKEMLNVKNQSTKVYLITSFKMMSVYAGALDLNALENLLENNGIIRSYPKLHSKIYLFDNERAIITSGNLTSGGMENNFEYGIYINDREIVNIISNDFNFLMKNESTGIITKKKLEEVKHILKNLRKSGVQNQLINSFDKENPEEALDIIDNSIEPIKKSLSGWKLEVFKCLNLIPTDRFSLNDINKFENHLQNIYPSNKHIKDKIRQQLQYLRDLGLIEFLGSGKYRKLWK